MIEHALKALGEAIQDAVDNASALASIRATLLVNFGPTSRSQERYGFQIDSEGCDNKDSTLKILYFVLDKLIERGGKPKC